MSLNSQPLARQSKEEAWPKIEPSSKDEALAQDGSQTRDSSQKPSRRERKARLAAGLLITFSPMVVWALWNLVFGNDFIPKHAWQYRLDPVQIYVWLLIAAGLLQLIAVYILRKSDQKPRDWISVASLIDAGLSIAFTLFFWTQISALIFRST
jgi:hypothetical protein